MNMNSTHLSRNKLILYIIIMFIILIILIDWFIYLHPDISIPTILASVNPAVAMNANVTPFSQSLCDTMFMSILNFLEPSLSVLIILLTLISLKFTFSLFAKLTELFFNRF